MADASAGAMSRTLRLITKPVGAIISAVAVAAVSAICISPNGEVIDRPTARAFFEMYWNDAINDPEAGWARLEPAFAKRANGDVSNYKRGLRDKYSDINVTSIIESNGVANRFEIEMKYYLRGSERVVDERHAFTLECKSWRDYVKVFKCNLDQIQIVDAPF